MNFTDDQKKIIDARDCNLLVSAAAGSGKTAVMVERIIQLITDTDNPVDIDKFLVVTFTRAAAAQMKEKISKRIEELLQEKPESEHLQRQAVLVHNALITTIDSFCVYVLRNNFADADIDAGFRIADENEVKLLKADVLSKVIENYYDAGNEAFIELAEQFSRGTSDESLDKMILKLYDTAMSDPWPVEWLKRHGDDYSTEDIMHSDWYISFIEYVLRSLYMVEQDLVSAYNVATLPDGPYMYGETIEGEVNVVSKVTEWLANEYDKFLADKSTVIDYDELCTRLEVIEFGKLAACRDKSVNTDVKDRASDLRKKAKEKIGNIKSKYLCRSYASNLTQMQNCDIVLKMLCEVTIEFKSALDKEMKDRGILSFADCEHLALEVLTKEGSSAAEDYRNHFEYVMIDEYQDSNLIQEIILSTVSGEADGKYNRFMVGDVKQSIYRFRQARPEIFIQKYDEYRPDDECCRLIDLHQNFRSRSSVLNFTNALFERVMSRNIGGVTYDDKAALHLGAKYCDDPENEYGAELLIYNPDEDDKYEGSIEARAVAGRIQNLMKTMKVRIDDKSTEVRPLNYGDIVILFRSPSKYADSFRTELEKYGIPVHVTGNAGFFKTYEIRMLMHLLRIIVNPLQDIYFYGVLESILGGFSVNEIALIKTRYMEGLGEKANVSEGYLYGACRYVAQSEEKDELTVKIAAFLGQLENYRAMSQYMTSEELLWKILSDTDYKAKICAMRGGSKRLANVDMLLEKAADYTRTSYFGLHNFIRYIDYCEKNEVDEAEAEVLDENADVVRIMSIHKSKGLEFPVCFVSGLTKGFNMQDTFSEMVVDGDLGTGIKAIDLDNRTKSRTLRAAVVADKIKTDTISEELRILYVALTRAKEKLILTADKADHVPKVIDYMDRISKDGIISPQLSGTASNFFDWILMAIAHVIVSRGKSFYQTWNGYIGSLPELNLDTFIYNLNDLELDNLADEIDTQLLKKDYDASYEAMDKNMTDSVCFEYLNRLLNAKYGHEELKGLHTKTSVSELKHAAMPEETEAVFELIQSGVDEDTKEYVPVFISGAVTVGGATVRGSAFHRVLELVDNHSLHNSESIYDALSKMLDEYALSGAITKEQRDIFSEKTYNGKKNLELLIEFLNSETGERMAYAMQKKALYKEAPFMMGIPASTLDPQYPDSETILIQGIIDVYWKEDDGYVILDYKTDRVENAAELIDRYKTQLDYYEKALNQMHLTVKEKLIYSFALGETIKL